MKIFIRLALTIFVIGLLTACGGSDNNAAPAKQSALYGTTVGNDTLGTSDLVLLNPTTGAYISTVGDVGFYVNGLTYDDTNDKLYATTSNNDPTEPDSLIEINQTTGAGTLIGAAGMLVNCPTVNSLGQMFGWTEDSDDAVSINKATGVATVLGDAGLSTSQQGLAFDNTDTLVLVNPATETDVNAYVINTTTGANTYITTFADIPRAHHGDFQPVTNYYVGIDQTADTAMGVERNLLVLDIANTTLIDTLPTADNLHCIAFGLR